MGRDSEKEEQASKVSNCTHTLEATTLEKEAQLLCFIYGVIRNDCQGFNNLPPGSPDATPCDFFLWGYVKDQVYVPPLSISISFSR